MFKNYKWILGGLVFAVLWSSAATATKVALEVSQPLVIAVMRFGVAALIMLVWVHLILRKPLPSGRLWGQLAIYGLLNITIYLGVYVIAMQQVTASVGALTVAVSPVFISFLSLIFLKKPLSVSVLLALVICMLGILVVAWPLLGKTAVTGWGLFLLLASMFSYSVGTIYFSAKNWQNLHLFVINGWQTLFGGIFLLPIAWLTYQPQLNQYSPPFWAGTLWLAIPVSIVAVILWLGLLKKDPVKAGLWLFLCPIFGIMIAAYWVGDAISWYTIAGVCLVILGLGITQWTSFKAKIKR